MIRVGDKLPAGKLQEYVEVEGNGCSLGPNSFAKTEYRYSNYNNLQHNMEGTDFQRNIDLDRHQVVAGIGFRF